MTDTFQSIRARFHERRLDSQARQRDIAAALGISEGELIAAHVGAAALEAPSMLTATRLSAPWPALIAALDTLGEVMALTRNASCVHEKTGRYLNASGGPGVGLVLGGPIDLRLFYTHWAHGYAVREHGPRGARRSLQFFDAAGVAIHKVFLKERSDVDAFERLVADHADPSQRPGMTAVAAPPTPPELADADIDVAGMRQAWSALRDTHDFFGLLRRYRVSRTQALRLAEPRFVQQVDAGSCRALLEAAAGSGVPIMVFTGNPGMIQIHSGPVGKIAVLGPWVNVLDAGFSLHLREDHIASAWVVKKPTVDGLVTSLELFDAQGESIAMFFGERKPGAPELCAWRALVANLDDEAASCAA